MKQNAMAVGYMRVSTDKQELEKNRLAILEYANHNGWQVEFVEETASGKLDWRKRKLAEVIEGGVRILIVPELSRLARSIGQIWEIIQEAEKRNFEIHILKEKLIIKKDKDLQTKAMLSVFAMVADFERELISLRTKEALRAKKEKGEKMGRPKGQSKLNGRKEEITRYIRLGLSVADIARLFDVGYHTARRFIVNNGLLTGVRRSVSKGG